MDKLNKSTYKDFKKYPIKVVQFGEGNFLRAFVDWQIDTLNRKAGFNGGVAIVQPLERGMVDMLNKQDGLYTLYLQGMKDGKPIRVHSIINCVMQGTNPYDDFDAYLALARVPTLRFLVSNTTEAGIAYGEGDKPDDRPAKSYPAKLTQFLFERFKTFKGAKDKGLILIPCELIDRNGEKLRELVLRYAAEWKLGDDFTNWLKESNTFCCSLVDRIVPGYPRDTIDQVRKELGYDDSLVDVGEYFHLWVIEGPKWIEKELPTGKAGLNVKFVDDMTPYRTRKVRILNGAHTTMVPVAYLYGLDTVREAVEHDVLGKFVHEAVFDEIIPTLDLPHEELVEFAGAVLERFRNPYVKHYLMSIALNSVSKYETRVLPSLLTYVQRNGRLPKKLVFSLASLFTFYKGKRGDEDIKLADDAENLQFFAGLWKECDGSRGGMKTLAEKALAYKSAWKRDLNEVPGLTDAVTDDLVKIHDDGMKKAVQCVL